MWRTTGERSDPARACEPRRCAPRRVWQEQTGYCAPIVRWRHDSVLTATPLFFTAAKKTVASGVRALRSRCALFLRTVRTNMAAVANGTTDRDGNGARAQGQVTASLEQVREILFGAPFRDLERKLLRVDTHLAAEAEELRKELRRRIGVLEGHVQRESEALTARFESERSAHADALTTVRRDSRDTVAALEQRVTKLEEALARAQRELRQQILDQAKSFLDEARQTRDEMAAAMERELTALTEPNEPVSERLLRTSAETRTPTPDH